MAIIKTPTFLSVTLSTKLSYMNAVFTKDEKDVMNAVKYMPAISIIMPFEPNISLKSELEHKLKLATQKVETMLFEQYPNDKAQAALHRLKNLVNQLNFKTNKKSIAIYVSLLIEKVFYLDLEVEEKIIIDESFEIRDLVYCKKQQRQFLVLLLSGSAYKLLLVDGKQFLPIKLNVPELSEAYKNDLPQRVANFTDPGTKKQILMDKFLHHVDEGLNKLLKNYSLPLFVLGPEKVLGHFNKHTKNKNYILKYIHGNYENASEAKIHKVLEPFLQEWKKSREKTLLKELEKAMDAKKVSFGIRDVWTNASQKNKRLLIVEKDFMYPAHQSDGNTIHRQNSDADNPFYIKDAVDDIIEKVLADNGDVEFVDNNLLLSYGRIALIHYY